MTIRRSSRGFAGRVPGCGGAVLAIAGFFLWQGISAPAYGQESGGETEAAAESAAVTGEAGAPKDADQPKGAESAGESSEAAASEESPKVSPVAEADADQEVAALTEEVSELRKEIGELSTALHELAALEKERDEDRKESAKPMKLDPPGRTLAQGAYYIGGTLGVDYTGRNNINNLFGNIDDGRRFRFSVEGIFGRVMKENSLALGMVVNYSYTNNVGVVTDTSDITTDKSEREYKLRAGPAFRQFISLEPTGHLFIYYQASLLFGYAESVMRGYQQDSSSVFTSSGYSFALAVQPGLMIAAAKNFTVEVGINVLGIDYTHYNTRTDYDDVGREDSASLSVDVNLLSLQFAFVGYF